MLGIALDTTPNLNQSLVDGILRDDTVFAGNAGVNGIVGLDSDNYAVSDMYFENATSKTVVGAGGVPDDVAAAWFIPGIRITTHFGLSISPCSKFLLYNNYMIQQTGVILYYNNV
jgi:hypothetical protein